MTNRQAILAGASLIEVFAQIEAEIPPSKFQHPLFNYWPLIRFLINSHLSKGGKDASVKAKPAPWAKYPLALQRDLRQRQQWAEGQAGIEAAALHPNCNEGLQDLPLADAMFITRTNQFRRSSGGQWADPFLGGLRDATSDLGSQISIAALSNSGFEGRLPEAYFALQLLSKRTNFGLLTYRSSADYHFRWRFNRLIERVNTLLAHIHPDLPISPSQALNLIHATANRIPVFLALFKQIQPKIVFISSFTGGTYICAAAKRYGIPVVDVQHGGMHRHHPIATNWTNMPVTGYELLPDYFWCWDQRSAKYIDFSPRHTGIHGGNTKLCFEAQSDGEPNEGANYSNRPKVTTPKGENRPQILVCLQYGKEPMIQPHVLEAYALTKDEVDWRIRLHPLGHDYLSDAAADFGIEEAVILAESAKPLSPTLLETDLLICDASTIVFEALDHGCACVLWSARGAKIFAELVSANRLDVHLDAKSLTNGIRQATTRGSGRKRAEFYAQKIAEETDQVRETYTQLLTHRARTT